MRLLIATLLCAAGLAAQSFGPVTASRIKPVAALPGTCSASAGQIYYLTTDNKLYLCTATNTWTEVGAATPETTSYAGAKTSATSWTITGATHGLGTCDFVWSVVDSSGNAISPSSYACDGSYDVTITFGVAQAGRFVAVKSGGGGGGAGTPGGSDGQVQFNNSGAFGGSSGLAYNDTTKSLGVIGNVTVGQTGTATGELKLNGTTSGTVTIKPAAAAGTWTMTLPSTAGTSGYCYKTDGSGGTSWAACGGVATAAGTAGQIQVNEDGSALGARSLTTGLAMDGTTLGVDTTTVAMLSGTQTVTGTKTYSGTLQVSGASSVLDASGSALFKVRVAAAPSGSCEDGEFVVTTAGVGYLCLSGTYATLASANNAVIGRASLTTTNAIPKVSASGTLGNSTITDDGTTVTTTGALSAQPGGTVAAWKKYTTAFSAAAFKAAATTVTTSLQACTMCVLDGVVLKHSTAFAGTGITAMTCKLTDGTNDLTPSFNVYQATGNTVLWVDGGKQIKTFASAPYTLSCTANTNLGNSAVSISAATNASPVEFTSTAHGLVNGNSVTISGATGGWTAINGTFVVTKTGDNTFTIPVDSTSFGALSGTVVWAGSFLTAGSLDVYLDYSVLP